MQPTAKATPVAKHFVPSVGDIVEVKSSEYKGEVIVVENGQVVLRHRDGKFGVYKPGDVQTYLGEDYEQFREFIGELMKHGNAGHVARRLWQEGYRSADKIAEDVSSRVAIIVRDSMSEGPVNDAIRQNLSAKHTFPGTRMRTLPECPSVLTNEEVTKRTAQVACSIATLMCSPVATPEETGTYYHAKAWMKGSPAKRKIWEAAVEVMSTALGKDASQAIGMFMGESEDDL